MTAHDVNLETLYSIILDAVRRYQSTPGMDCRQPQTFRVLQLDRGAELTTPAMGATLSDKDTPYFYSRTWERQKFNPNNITADFPVCTAFELSSDLPKGISETTIKQCYSVELSVLDVFQIKCDGKPYRTINQIYADTEKILLNIVNYISGSIIATVGDVTGVYNRSVLNSLVACGEIAQYDEIYDIGGVLQSENKGGRTVHVEMPTNNIYGTKMRLTFCIYRCLDVQFGGINCVDPVNQFAGC